jgi:hypothetical protein
LSALILASPGLALAPIVVFGLADAARRRELHASLAWGIVALAGIGVSALEVAGLAPGLTARLWTPLAQLSPLAQPDLGLVGGLRIRPWSPWLGIGLSVAFLLLARWPVSRRGYPGDRNVESLAIGAAGRMACAVMLSLGLIAIIQQLRWTDWLPNRDRLVAFKQVQRWAALNSPRGAIFMGDPDVANGWREYSERAWYGSISELSHFATLYDSVPGLFAKGIGRVREFGVDPLGVEPSALAMPGGGKYGISVLAPKISTAFNAMTIRELRAIAARHGVRYLVVLRSARKVPLEGIVPVYSNAEYDVYDLGTSAAQGI